MTKNFWQRSNKILEGFKHFPLFRLLYKLPFAPRFYHLALAWMGAILYRFPGKKIFAIGVTGTKGKTTTLELVNAIVEQAGKKTALLSSLRVKIGGESELNMAGNTMPGRFFIQKFLRDATRAGCEYALIEVTSQGVVASRHKFINWYAGIITNVAPEHIESHGSFENYREAKLKFLRTVVRLGGFAYVNGDDEKSKYFIEKLQKTGKVIVYSKNDLSANNIIPDNQNISGDFGHENLAAAVAFANQLGIDSATINEAIKNFRGVPGRMEFVQREPFTVVVDYAHTPDSLRAVYKTLSETCRMSHDTCRMVCVLGSAGGGRDKWKRPEMGKIAAEYCDGIILTNEDPYDENPEEILEQISSGFSQSQSSKLKAKSFSKILDRREALQKAISLAKPGDVVVVTGKGSEPYMHFEKGKKIPWDEKGVVEEILKIK